MIVRIGVGDIAKEIQLEMEDDTDLEELKSEIESGLESEKSVIWLSDKDGRQVGIPVAKVTFVDIGSQSAPKIGFGA
ncbi:MAG: DUF3107 domain-containing protein [Acidimicrobiales bacterium]|jgi:hypothetical protein|nr:DUF3107 domain-containing protein [Acidimicrobiales bacterium]MDP6298891.1 DUF3107 domain-containing protein [Acidimicrobiales bacterium]HJM27776.1 DUF3107 domain-containing protein [Acidimicrobiales bacterium]HJM98083.1 DUF3107 domain-containing protein [Acidimicrobiales bacterium]